MTFVIFVQSSTHVHAFDNNDSFVLSLNFAPSIVETGKAVYPVGFVKLVSNITGGPVLAPRDLEVELLSKDTSIALVPPRVVIPAGSDYARFNVDVGYVTGETEVSALFGNQIVSKNFKVVEAANLVQKNFDIVINLPSDKMQVQAEMPFSVYLENNGNIVQAAEDLTVRFDYERSLVELSSDTITIKKGSYYATGVIKSLEKSGNAFIKAMSNVGSEDLNTVTNVVISQTQPVSLKVNVFPDRISQADTTVDIFVQLLDSTGQPTLASDDVKLELFSSSTQVKLDNINAVIKKGEAGAHIKPSVYFYLPQSQPVTIGASAPGLGATSANFDVLTGSLSISSPKAADRVLKVFTVGNMPSDSTSIVVYQLNAIEHDSDDGTDVNGDGRVDQNDHSPIDDLPEGALFPIQSLTLYSAGQDNLNIVSGNNWAASISDPGWIPAGSSYGTATITSGRQADSVNISVSLANTAAGTSPITIVGSLNPIQTMIFSPAGKMSDGSYRILFDRDGHSDLFFITLDSADRPSNAEKGVKYLIKPVNELAEIMPGKSFAIMSINSYSFGPNIENALEEVDAVPIGVNADSSLEVKSSLHLIFYSGTTSQVVLPFNSMVGFSKEHQIGAVQLRDATGYPVLASDDVIIKLSSSSVSNVFPTPTITIPKGKSFASFAIATFGRADNFTISASAEGLQSSSATVTPILADLHGSFANEDRLAISIPNKIIISTPTEGASVLWGMQADLKVASKDDKTATYDPASNSFVASAQVLSDKPGTFTIDVTLLKDGFKTIRISKSVAFEPQLAQMKTTIQYDQNAALSYGQPIQMSVLVQDANGKPISGAVVQVEESGAAGLVVISTLATDQNGAAGFAYIPTQSESSQGLSTIVVTAYKDGYKPSRDSKVLEVASSGMLPAIPVVGSTLGLPTWMTYAVIGGAAAGGGGFYYFKRLRGSEEENDDLTVEENVAEVEEREEI